MDGQPVATSAQQLRLVQQLLWDAISQHLYPAERDEIRRQLGPLALDDNAALFAEAGALADILGHVQLATEPLLARQALCSNPQRSLVESEIRLLIDRLHSAAAAAPYGGAAPRQPRDPEALLPRGGRKDKALLDYVATAAQIAESGGRPPSAAAPRRPPTAPSAAASRPGTSSRPPTASAASPHPSRPGTCSPSGPPSAAAPASSRPSTASSAASSAAARYTDAPSVVAGVADKLSLASIEAVRDTLRGALADERAALLEDVEYLQGLLEAETDFQARAAAPPPSLAELREYTGRLAAVVAEEEARVEHEERVSAMFAAAESTHSRPGRLRGMVDASRRPTTASSTASSSGAGGTGAGAAAPPPLRGAPAAAGSVGGGAQTLVVEHGNGGGEAAGGGAGAAAAAAAAAAARRTTRRPTPPRVIPSTTQPDGGAAAAVRAGRSSPAKAAAAAAGAAAPGAAAPAGAAAPLPSVRPPAGSAAGLLLPARGSTPPSATASPIHTTPHSGAASAAGAAPTASGAAGAAEGGAAAAHAAAASPLRPLDGASLLAASPSGRLRPPSPGRLLQPGVGPPPGAGPPALRPLLPRSGSVGRAGAAAEGSGGGAAASSAAAAAHRAAAPRSNSGGARPSAAAGAPAANGVDAHAHAHAAASPSAGAAVAARLGSPAGSGAAAADSGPAAPPVQPRALLGGKGSVVERLEEEVDAVRGGVAAILERYNLRPATPTTSQGGQGAASASAQPRAAR